MMALCYAIYIDPCIGAARFRRLDVLKVVSSLQMARKSFCCSLFRIHWIFYCPSLCVKERTKS
jgi:hypothetical protein